MTKNKRKFNSKIDQNDERFAKHLFHFIFCKFKIIKGMIPLEEKILEEDYAESKFTEDIGMSVVCLQVSNRELMREYFYDFDESSLYLTHEDLFFVLLESYIDISCKDETGKSNIFLEILLSCSVTAEIFILQHEFTKCLNLYLAPDFWLKYFRNKRKEFYTQGGWETFNEYAHRYRKIYKRVEEHISRIKKPYDRVPSLEEHKRKYHWCILQRNKIRNAKANGSRISNPIDYPALSNQSCDDPNPALSDRYQALDFCSPESTSFKDSKRIPYIESREEEYHETYKAKVSRRLLKQNSKYPSRVDTSNSTEEDIYADVKNLELQLKEIEGALNLDLSTLPNPGTSSQPDTNSENASYHEIYAEETQKASKKQVTGTETVLYQEAYQADAYQEQNMQQLGQHLEENSEDSVLIDFASNSRDASNKQQNPEFSALTNLTNINKDADNDITSKSNLQVRQTEEESVNYSDCRNVNFELSSKSMTEASFQSCTRPESSLHSENYTTETSKALGKQIRDIESITSPEGYEADACEVQYIYQLPEENQIFVVVGHHTNAEDTVNEVIEIYNFQKTQAEVDSVRDKDSTAEKFELSVKPITGTSFQPHVNLDSIQQHQIKSADASNALEKQTVYIENITYNGECQPHENQVHYISEVKRADLAEKHASEKEILGFIELMGLSDINKENGVNEVKNNLNLKLRKAEDETSKNVTDEAVNFDLIPEPNSEVLLQPPTEPESACFIGTSDQITVSDDLEIRKSEDSEWQIKDTKNITYNKEYQTEVKQVQSIHELPQDLSEKNSRLVLLKDDSNLNGDAVNELNNLNLKLRKAGDETSKNISDEALNFYLTPKPNLEVLLQPSRDSESIGFIKTSDQITASDDLKIEETKYSKWQITEAENIGYYDAYQIQIYGDLIYQWSKRSQENVLHGGVIYKEINNSILQLREAK